VSGTNICKYWIIVDSFGVPITEDKTVEICTRLVFLGVAIDTHKRMLCIPETKVTELRSLLIHNMGRRKVKLKELHSLVGSFLLPGKSHI